MWVSTSVTAATVAGSDGFRTSATQSGQDIGVRPGVFPVTSPWAWRRLVETFARRRENHKRWLISLATSVSALKATG